MKKLSWLNPFSRNIIRSLIVVLILSACSFPLSNPVEKVVENTVVVVITATNPPGMATNSPDMATNSPATAVPALPVETATDTPIAKAAPTGTPVPTVVLPTPTLKPVPTLVRISELPVPGPIGGKVRILPIGSIQMDVQYIPDTTSGDPHVTKVNFEIFKGSDLVFQSEDNKSPYCAFGDKGSICSAFIFDDYVNTWPGSHLSIESGIHLLRITVHDNDSDPLNNSWKVEVPFNIILP
jgi:hypothetical protein